MSTNLTWPIKDVNEELDYAVNWTDALTTGEVIDTSVISVISGDVVIEQQFHSDTVSTVWLSGGTAGQTARIGCTITTTSTPPRTLKQVVALPLVNRAA